MREVPAISVGGGVTGYYASMFHYSKRSFHRYLIKIAHTYLIVLDRFLTNFDHHSEGKIEITAEPFYVKRNIFYKRRADIENNNIENILIEVRSLRNKF